MVGTISDRGMMMSGMGMGSTMPMMGQMGTMASASMPGMGMMTMVPRCTMKMEKIPNGMKVVCACEDETSAFALQNMCKMLTGSMCSMCCMMNGMMMCMCNMAMCKCECTDMAKGVTFNCTSGDKAMAAMIQACCDCVCECMKAGCTGFMCLGAMPVCCGTSC